MGHLGGNLSANTPPERARLEHGLWHIKAVLFDLGGTLIDYKGGLTTWEETEQRALRAVYRLWLGEGRPLPDETTFLQSLAADMDREWKAGIAGLRPVTCDSILQGSSQALGLTLTPAEVRQATLTFYNDLRTRLILMPGAVETVAALRRQGQRLGLVSNTIWPGDWHREDMRRFNLLDYFESLHFSADIGDWKPGTAIFQRTLAALGVTPQEAVYVGDVPEVDVIGAQRSGMKAILIDPNQQFTRLDSIVPEARIAALPELVELLAPPQRRVCQA